MVSLLLWASLLFPCFIISFTWHGLCFCLIPAVFLYNWFLWYSILPSFNLRDDSSFLMANYCSCTFYFVLSTIYFLISLFHSHSFRFPMFFCIRLQIIDPFLILLTVDTVSVFVFSLFHSSWPYVSLLFKFCLWCNMVAFIWVVFPCVYEPHVRIVLILCMWCPHCTSTTNHLLWIRLSVWHKGQELSQWVGVSVQPVVWLTMP